MSFCTAINCMDGRTQAPVMAFLQKRFGVEYVDMVTEAGPVRVLAEGEPADRVRSILDRLRISIEAHGSVGIAIVAHHDCAGNPVGRREQSRQLERAISKIRPHCGDLETIGLWVDRSWEVCEITKSRE